MLEDAALNQSEPHGARGRGFVIAFVLVVGFFAAYFALGMPGMHHGTPDQAMPSGMEHTAFEGLTPAEFAARGDRVAAFVVNVHTPNEGDIPGTDASIPYDRITGDPRLPSDKNTEILLYCRTGRMSAEAATALRAAGYTKVADLDGGMQNWQATGRPILREAR
jgi:rhodanese-related sulfurtransferase